EIEAAYEKAMLREVDDICNVIPHKDLCIQWDICHEMIMWDGQITKLNPPLDDIKTAIINRIAKLCSEVPGDVECGIHLCYGDMGAKHFVQPRDATKLMEIANAISESVKRPLAYIHMPVPIERNDEAYFQPLSNLRLQPGMELYLGLVHADGAPKVQAR